MFQPGTLKEVLALIGCILFMTLVRGLNISQQYAAWLTLDLLGNKIRVGAKFFQLLSRLCSL
jgi:hypothetical protein